MDNNENKGSIIQFLKKTFGILINTLYFLVAGILYILGLFLQAAGPELGFFLLLIIALPFLFFYWQINSSFEPFDLLARYFGAGLGAVLGLLSGVTALLGFGIMNCCFSRCKNDDASPQETEEKEESSEQTSEETVEETPKSILTTPIEQTKLFKYIQSLLQPVGKGIEWLLIRLSKYILYPLLWIALSVLIPASFGSFLGLCIDSNYASFFSTEKNVIGWGYILDTIFVIAAFLAIQILLLVKCKPTACSKRHSRVRFYTGIVLILLPIIATCIGTEVLCRPAIPYKDKELECGVYIYSNNTSYNVKGVNIYSSRCGGFSHSGFCLITKDPETENAQLQKLGLKPLRFTKLQRGYYVNMISMVVPDVDGFTNYQSRCYPQENAYQFDIDALKNYLAGHSPNDLPAPALQLKLIPVTDVSKSWNCIEEFKQTYNKRFPNGMVYSPIPYTDEHVKTINCNTYSATVLDTLSKNNLIKADNQQTIDQFEEFFNPRFSFGGQTMADGQKLNEFLAQDDAPEQVKRHWEFVKTAPLSEQNFWANVLRPDSDFGKSLSTLVEKPKD